jgi:hypothetical protein
MCKRILLAAVICIFLCLGQETLHAYIIDVNTVSVNNSVRVDVVENGNKYYDEQQGAGYIQAKATTPTGTWSSLSIENAGGIDEQHSYQPDGTIFSESWFKAVSGMGGSN